MNAPIEARPKHSEAKNHSVEFPPRAVSLCGWLQLFLGGSSTELFLARMSGYTKLFSSIIASTIWRESDKTRIVWITMLAMADRDGFVAASVPGLADMARVSIEDVKTALASFLCPDEYSRSQEDEGRRIRAVEGGWVLVNHAKYREDPAGRMLPSDEKPGKIYFIQCGTSIKIGFSQNPWARLATLKTGMPDNPRLLGHFQGTLQQERDLHERFSALRINREWFRATKELLTYVASAVATTEHGIPTTKNYNTEAEAEADTDTKADTEAYSKAKAVPPKELTASAPSGFAVPPCFEKVDGFAVALAGWIEARKKKRNPPTGLAIQLLIDRLAEQPHRAVEALRAAIESGWTTVKWEYLDNQNSKTAKPPERVRTYEHKTFEECP